MGDDVSKRDAPDPNGGNLGGKWDSLRNIGRSNVSSAENGFLLTRSRRIIKVATGVLTDCSLSLRRPAVSMPSQATGALVTEPALPSRAQSGTAKRYRSSINEQLWGVLTNNRFVDALVGVASPSKKSSHARLSHGRQEQTLMVCAHKDDADDGILAKSLGADQHTATRLQIRHAEAKTWAHTKSKGSIDYEQSGVNNQSECEIRTSHQQEPRAPIACDHPDEILSQRDDEDTHCKLRQRQHLVVAHGGNHMGEVQEQKRHSRWKPSDHHPKGSSAGLGSDGPRAHEDDACGQGSHYFTGAFSSGKREQREFKSRNASASSDNRQRKKKGTKKAAPSGLKGAAARLRRGVVVRLHGLQKFPELNGALGLCLGPSQEIGSGLRRGARWNVHFEFDDVADGSGEGQVASAGFVRTVRRENLQVIGFGGASRRDAKDPERGKRGLGTPSQDQIVHGIAVLECSALERCSPSERVALKRKLLLKWHPDKAPSSANQTIATKVMQTMLSLPQWQR